MATPDVQLELGARKRTTRARLVEDGSEDDALARRLMLEKAARDVDDLSEWGRTALVVAIDWPGGTSYTSLI